MNLRSLLVIINKVRGASNKYGQGYICQCKCDNCGKIFDRKAHWAERTKHQFCTEECACVYKSTQVSGSGNNHWNGGKRQRADGYIGLYKPNHPNRGMAKVVPEHRIVMEEMLGRKLTKKEIVHHINGIRDDNRPENLLLFAGQGEHAVYHFVYIRIVKILAQLFRYNCLEINIWG